jgi:sugar O-acyltransferase (sialic acid O-acetyltransferase NeuD family)
MKKNLYIVGAGDFGREMESWLELLPNFNNEYSIIGYLDDNCESLQGKPSDYKVLGSPLNYEFSKNDYVLLTISDPQIRKNIVDSLFGKVNLFSYVSPDVIIGKYTKVGNGTIICSNCFISTNTVIGECVIINNGSSIGHDCTVGSYSSIMANVDFGGNVSIGEGVYVGTKSTIIPGKSISSGIVIGAGSVVIRNINKTGTYFGNPAKLIGNY